MSRKLLRIPTVAQILDVTEDRVYSLAREGVLPHVRLGRQIRVDNDALETFINDGGKALPGGWRKKV